MPSPCTSHALLRESPAVSPQPPRSLLQRLSLRKTSRVSLLSLSSVASSPGHDLRRSVEDFFRAPLGRRREWGVAAGGERMRNGLIRNRVVIGWEKRGLMIDIFWWLM